MQAKELRKYVLGVLCAGEYPSMLLQVLKTLLTSQGITGPWRTGSEPWSLGNRPSRSALYRGLPRPVRLEVSTIITVHFESGERGPEKGGPPTMDPTQPTEREWVSDKLCRLSHAHAS